MSKEKKPSQPQNNNGTASAKKGPVYDVLAPWGSDGPPPADQWRRDILGDGYESQTLPLKDDDEGPVVATLVRRLPEPSLKPSFVCLYFHGRNDYFFQTELADQIDAAGGLFFALDLRKFGRSLRPGQTIGHVSDLNTYSEDIDAALKLIRTLAPDLPLVLLGHSTGGLISTLWAWRHQSEVSALILNSAWLEMQTLAPLRSTVQPILTHIAAHYPMWEVPTGGNDNWSRSLLDGWSRSGFPLPKRLENYRDDPAIKGWSYIPEWKRAESYPVHAEWLNAIMAGQDDIKRRVLLKFPVLSMMATSSYLEDQWDPKVFTADTVLETEILVDRSAHLGPLVTIARFNGKHDLTLSDPDIRKRVWRTMNTWLNVFFPRQNH